MHTKLKVSPVSFHKVNEYTHVITSCSNETLSRACPPHSRPFYSTPHHSGGRYPIYVTLVSDPPGHGLSLQTLSCCCLPVSGAPRSPAAVSEGGLGGCPRRPCGCCCAWLVPARADLRVVCAQSTLPGGLCSGAVGSPARGRLGEATPILAASWPDGSGRVENAVSSSLRVGETQVHPLGAAGSPVVHTPCQSAGSHWMVVKLPLLQPTKKGSGLPIPGLKFPQIFANLMS